MDIISVVPKNFPIFGVVDGVSIKVMNFNVNATTCQIYYSLYSGGVYRTSGYLDMSEEDFESWGQDNNYVKEWALEKMEMQEDVIQEENDK